MDKLKYIFKTIFFISLVIFLAPILILILGVGGEGYEQAGWIVPMLVMIPMALSGFLWLISDIFFPSRSEVKATDDLLQVDVESNIQINKSIKKTQIVIATIIVLFFFSLHQLVLAPLQSLEIYSTIEGIVSMLIFLVLIFASVHLVALFVKKNKLKKYDKRN